MPAYCVHGMALELVSGLHLLSFLQSLVTQSTTPELAESAALWNLEMSFPTHSNLPSKNLRFPQIPR